MSTYAIALFPTPIFNTPRFPHHHPSLSLFKDEQGLMRSLETIAFPSSKFTIQKEIDSNVVQVTTLEYPSDTPLYVDRRFLQDVSFNAPEREKWLPSSSDILAFMVSLVGTRYLWGGNWADGISEMVDFYPHLSAEIDQDDVVCKGVDCSGLLYQATHGITPRNTSQLIHYGKEVLINPVSLQQIQEKIQPLDMLVWKGHVIFALNQKEIIESVGGKGVVINSWKDRYPQIVDKIQSENKILYLRRWHPEMLKDASTDK